MTREQFQIQMNRLIECFGKGAYGTERCLLIWKAVDGMETDWFKSTIEGFISSSRQAPMVVDFKDLASTERHRLWEIQKHKPISSQADWNPSPRCSTCRDGGVYLCTNPNRPGIWAFRCHCEKGDADPRRSVPQFKTGHVAEGFLYCDMSKRAEIVETALV